MRMFIRPLLFVLTAVFVLTACGGSTAAPATDNSPADVKIMVGGLNKQIYIPNKLAELLGYFKEQNLNVTLIDEGSGQASEEEVRSRWRTGRLSPAPDCISCGADTAEPVQEAHAKHVENGNSDPRVDERHSDAVSAAVPNSRFSVPSPDGQSRRFAFAKRR